MHHRHTFAVILSLAAIVSGAPSAVRADGMACQLPAFPNAKVQERGDRLYLATQRLARHLLASVKPWSEAPTLGLATDSRSGEHHIRPNTGLVCGLGFLYRFGPYDEHEVGLSRAALLQEKILPMIRYLTATHVSGSRATGDGKPWGDAWQSALWSALMGRGAWFIGPDLPADVADGVRRVVAHEAQRIADAEPPHQLHNDTKAEENAWNSSVLSVAMLLMPDDPRRPLWEQQFHKWAFSSFLRPADEHSREIVDGKPVAELFTGANIHDDFTLENHHIVHPDYMTTYSSLLNSGLEHALTGRPIPQALLHNVPGIYENLKWFCLPDGGFVYPSGQDWALFRNVDWLAGHTLMAAFGRDPEAWPLADQALTVLEKMQARTPTGTVYLPEENFFASGQTDKLAQFSMAWLALHFATGEAAVEPRRQGVRRLESAKIILNRTPSAIHTFSWGAKIMGQCVPFRLDRIVSPHDRSGVGVIRLAGQEKPLPVALVDARVTNSDDAFTAELEVDHGAGAVRAHLHYCSHPDGRWTMREKLVAMQDVTLEEVATGLVGILNNERWIYESGRRQVRIGDQRTTVTSCAGTVLTGDDIREVDIDGVLHIRSERPLRVRYQAAAKPARSRVTDELTLNHLSGPRSWPAGETISEFEVQVTSTRRVPLIYGTDLFHPHDDPDDHFDLATVFALPEFDVRAILLDLGDRQKERPGRVPVEQMLALTGQGVPYAVGLNEPLRSPTDTGQDQPTAGQQAVELLLATLRASPRPVVVVTAGSVRDVCAAFNREPDLLRRKIDRLYINIGNLDPDQEEWNVGLDRHAYVGLMRSGLPIYWCPCLPMNANRSTHWKFRHADLFDGMPVPLLNFFIYALQRVPPDELDPMMALRGDLRPWRHLLLPAERNMWCTGPLLHAAGRRVHRIGNDWIAAPDAPFTTTSTQPRSSAAGAPPASTDTSPQAPPVATLAPPPAAEPADVFTFVPARVTIDDQGVTHWVESAADANMHIYKVLDAENHTPALQSCLRRLLHAFPLAVEHPGQP